MYNTEWLLNGECKGDLKRNDVRAETSVSGESGESSPGAHYILLGSVNSKGIVYLKVVGKNWQWCVENRAKEGHDGMQFW